MRILHVSDCFPPRLGGIETQVSTLIQQQQERGHEVQVLTLTNGAKDSDVIRLRPHLGSNVLIRFGSRRDVEQVCKEFRPDVIHAHVGSGAWLAWASVKVAQKRALPLVLSIHSVWGKLANTMYNNRLHRTGSFRVVCVSEQAKFSIMNSQNLHVIANGLDIEEWKADTSKSHRLTFVTASRLVARKRLIELVEMFTRLQSRYPNADFELRIAGDGPMRTRIAQHLERENISFITLLGRVSKNELKEEYAKAHAYIQLSRLEAFGLAAAEAQASGLCVIGLKESGISDFVQHNVDGFLGEHDAEVEEFLTMVIANPDNLDTLRNNIDVASKPYHWNRVLDKYDEVYKNIRGAS